MSTNQFGGPAYTSPETRELTSITESPNPDARDFASAEKMAELLQRHDFQIKALAQGQQQLQQGVNDATNNPIQQIQQFIADVIVLLGGGEITSGLLDFGDLQYILPTLGALFGLGDAPFPIDLFQAAEKFFFGYVVPQQQFTDEINTIISNWLTTIGIDPEFIKDLKALVTALGNLFGSVGNIFPSLASFFGELGIDANDLGPLGQILKPIINFFSGLDLKNIGHLLEFITNAIDPFVQQLTAVINFINAVLVIFNFDVAGGGGVVNSPLPELTAPFENLITFLGDIDLGPGNFNPLQAAENFIKNVLSPTGLLASIDSIVESITGLTGDGISLADVQAFFANLRSFLGGIDLNIGDFDPIAAAEQFITTVLDRTGLLTTIEGIAQDITGVANGNGDDISKFFGNFKSFMAGIDLNADDFDPIAAATQFVNGVLMPLNLLLGRNSQIKLAQLTNTSQELLWNPGFSGAISITGRGIWTWDGDVYFTADTDATPGSAKVTADGTYKALRSNSADVSAGQTLNLSVRVLTDGLVGDGDLIQIMVAPFTGTTQGDFVTLDSIGAPTDAATGWTGAPATAKTATLSGTYAVPDGVDSVQFRLVVLPTATAGTINFDSASEMRVTDGLPQEWVNGLTTALTNIGTFINQLGDVFNGLVVTPVNDAVSQVIDWFNGLVNYQSDTTSATVANASKIAALEAARTGTDNYGNHAADDFNRTTGLGTDWAVTGDGTISTDGANATLAAGTKAIATYQPLKSMTNYQVIKLVLVSAPKLNSDFVYLIGRSSADRSSYVFARLNASSAALGFAAGGAETVWATQGDPPYPRPSIHPRAGDTWELWCGTGNAAGQFEVIRNGATVINYTDAGAQSHIGDSYLDWGFGLAGANPGAVAVWTANDNTPAPIIGSVCRVYRASTAGVGTAVAIQTVPGNTFDTVDKISPDMTWDKTTSKLTVSKPGMYMVRVRLEFSTVIGANANCCLAIYRNGAVYEYGAESDGAPGVYGVAVVSGASNLSETFMVYCDAGDSLQPGCVFGTQGLSIVGDSTGAYTAFTVSRISDLGAGNG